MKSRDERRILVLAPTSRDAALTCDLLLEQNIDCTICRDVAAVVRELEQGAGAILIAEEIVTAGLSQPIADAITAQPPWSDLPVMLITAQGADSSAVSVALESLGNVTLVERPTRVTALVSTVQSALRARERQYQARAYLAERERASEALKLGDRRKDEFLATLAHELRNPLAPIRNSLHILRMTASNDSTADRVCEMMERQVNHMVRLVDDLMEVSRITRGLIELRKEETDLAVILRSAIETSKPLVAAGEHQLSISLPHDPIPLHGDAVRLAQVFANLLNNAAKYTDRGGQIQLAARREGEFVLVSVRDDGVGISAQTLPMIFDMFMQEDRSTKRSQGGLGIGLTLVKSLVEMHGGSVSVRSEGPGLGSEFTVRLPIAPAPSRQSQEPAIAPGIANLSRRRVLVVDDNEDAAASLAMLLKFLGTEVEVAHDGPTALKLIDSHRPDVVLLDLGMPGMDGYEVARQVRTRHDLANTVLIALTGWGQSEDRDRTRLAGFDHHLVKPADIKVLQSLLVSVGK